MKNFVNPKKIKGKDKLDRIKDLMGKMSTLNESTSTSEVENVKKGANGVIYGIIRENHSYFIKTTEKTSGTILAEDFNYIGGLQNKNMERYGSYAEALKQLNLKFDMLNESFGIKDNSNLFESDAVEVKEANASGVVVKEEEKEVIEDQKKVIKVDAPAPAPVEDEVADEEEVSMEEDPFAEEGGEEEVSMDMDVEEEGGEDDGDGYTKKIQKLTGKIGQLLRDKDEPDAELDKYVINSIISAIDWEEIPDEDVEDIIAKIEGEDEEDGELEGGDEESVDIDMDVEEEGGEDPFAEEGGEELAESDEKEDSKIDGKECVKLIKQLKSAIEGFEKSLSDGGIDPEGIIGAQIHKMIKEHKKMLTKVENDCKGIKMDESDEPVEEGNKFSGERQKAIDAGEDTFTVDGETYEVTGKKEEKNESRKFSKKQLMENFLKKNINNSLNKILLEQSQKNHLCEECMGAGCRKCESVEEGVTDLDLESGNDINTVKEENMSVVDAIATGQNYLQASGDLDRDGDQIPNRLDMDSNMDGELDHPTFDDEEFIEIDFDSLMGNSPAPTKEPGIAPPSTTPGRKKPRWKKIPRPEVNPKPKATNRRKFHLGRKGMYR
tara:strand:- start:1193 stop:3013 length:1821 start_codon:yes stop_codon:yes gene_type:complete